MARERTTLPRLGDAQVIITDCKGRKQKVILKDALCITSYRQDILSVPSVAENGGIVKFNRYSANLETPDGNVFNIEKSGKLYYLNSVKSLKARTHSRTSMEVLI